MNKIKLLVAYIIIKMYNYEQSISELYDLS